jgi:mRNA-degrading endonuclease HigB of HigAB toxin-antitoxin module
MPFYINKRGFSIEGCDVLLVHNVFTGSKQIYINNIMEKIVPPHFFECLNRHPININGNRYELIVKPSWYGTFKYDIEARDYGYGLLDEALL